MIRLQLLCGALLLIGGLFPAHGEQSSVLRLIQTIPLPGVPGRLDHMAIDLEKKRLFVAAVANGTIEVLDLDAGKLINSIPGIKDAQDALFLGGDFNKLYVSSLDGTLRIFQGETFRLVQALKLEPDPNRLLYDPATDLVYFGYGGQNAGFDAYARVGVLQAAKGARSDQFIADMIAPTFRPGHLAEMALDDGGRLLVCDSRADLIFQFDTRKRELLKSWAARGDGAGDMSLDRIHHRLFVGTRIPPEMTVYDSESGKEIVSLQASRNHGRCPLRCKVEAYLRFRRPLVRDPGGLAGVGLRVPATGCRSLRVDFQGQNEAGLRYLFTGSASEPPLRGVPGDRRSGGSGAGLRARPLVAEQSYSKVVVVANA